jgi:hypothetical protein
MVRCPTSEPLVGQRRVQRSHDVAVLLTHLPARRRDEVEYLLRIIKLLQAPGAVSEDRGLGPELRATAAHETTVAAGLHRSTIRYRQAMEQIAIVSPT